MSLRTHWMGITTAIISLRTDSSSDAILVRGFSASQHEVDAEARFLLLLFRSPLSGEELNIEAESPLRLDIRYAL